MKPMTQEEFARTDGFACPYCGKRNTNEMGSPEDHSGDVLWEVECHDCGREYTILFKIAGYLDDKGQPGLHELRPKLVALIIAAVKTVGSYDPDDTMILFEEHLTDHEYTIVSAFLRWVHTNDRKFGHGNIQDVFRECQDAIGRLGWPCT